MNNQENYQQNNLNQSDIHVRRLCGVLQQITQLAREASLTGSLDQGARSAAQQFNRILQIVEQKDIVLGGLFEPLPEEASFDQIGVAAAQLIGFLEVDLAAEQSTMPHPPHPPLPPHPPVPPHPPSAPFFAPSPQGHRNEEGAPNFVIDMSQFKDIEQLKGLGQMIREQLPEWIKREVESRMSAVHEHIAQAQAAAHPMHGQTQVHGQGEVQTDAQGKASEEAQTVADRHRTERLPDVETFAYIGSQPTFQDMDMSGARFSDTNLAGAAFSDVNFDNVEFNDVNFSNVSFHDTNFANASFHDTNFDNARLHNPNCHNVEIIDGEISGMKINGVAIDELLRRYKQE